MLRLFVIAHLSLPSVAPKLILHDAVADSINERLQAARVAECRSWTNNLSAKLAMKEIELESKEQALCHLRRTSVCVANQA